MSRIDGVTVKIYAADEFEGHRTVEFEVPIGDESDPFVQMIAAKWHEYTLRLWEQARHG